MKMHKIAMLVLAAAVLLALSSLAGRQCMPGTAGIAYGQDDWKTEFEAICGRTQEAAAMSIDELRTLVDRCDKLRPRIEQLDETRSKVYLKRLRMCRDLFAFVLESKEKK
jgi:hypothetical protein